MRSVTAPFMSRRSMRINAAIFSALPFDSIRLSFIGRNTVARSAAGTSGNRSPLRYRTSRMVLTPY